MEGADEAAIDAFVLTARFFFQDRDGISFRRMAEIYDGPSVPASLADRYRDCRAKLNAYLDLPPGMVANAKAVTQGDIRDVLLYGQVAAVSVGHVPRPTLDGSPSVEVPQVTDFWRCLNSPAATG
jgi:hypothetical protein